jgi:hypothetical protein
MASHAPRISGLKDLRGRRRPEGFAGCGEGVRLAGEYVDATERWEDHAAGVRAAHPGGAEPRRDREGNVALFTPFDRLCYQARGANAVSCGCENMHASTSEGWSEHQFRAAAWVVNQAKDKHGIPASNGELGAGNGAVRVLERGQVSHQRVSSAAGYNDRTDPGPGYNWSHARDLVIHWRAHHTFEGAPS